MKIAIDDSLTNNSVNISTMRSVQRLLASSESISGGVGSLLRGQQTPLLPPIPLLRRILRTNRKLPSHLRILGDLTVKEEFRAHRDAENPIHIVCIEGFAT
jgi:hypothetical protein